MRMFLKGDGIFQSNLIGVQKRRRQISWARVKCSRCYRTRLIKLSAIQKFPINCVAQKCFQILTGAHGEINGFKNSSNSFANKYRKSTLEMKETPHCHMIDKCWNRLFISLKKSMFIGYDVTNRMSCQPAMHAARVYAMTGHKVNISSCARLVWRVEVKVSLLSLSAKAIFSHNILV